MPKPVRIPWFPAGRVSGTNPDGTRYHDPGIRWISYLNHGDAIHAFNRSSVGTPQSLGCVELPLAAAANVWPYTPIGTLVTVRADSCPRRTPSEASRGRRELVRVVVEDTRAAVGAHDDVLDPHAEGMLVRGAKGLDVGDRVTVKLISTDPERGFIDFAI